METAYAFIWINKNTGMRELEIMSDPQPTTMNKDIEFLQIASEQAEAFPMASERLLKKMILVEPVLVAEYLEKQRGMTKRTTPKERATKAHYADGHRKSCSPCCAVEINFIAEAIRDAEIEALEWALERTLGVGVDASEKIRTEIERRKRTE